MRRFEERGLTRSGPKGPHYRRSTWHLAPGTWHPAPGTRHPAPGTRHPLGGYVLRPVEPLGREVQAGIVGQGCAGVFHGLRAQWLVGLEQLFDRSRRERTGKEVALRVSAAKTLQFTRLHIALDALRDHAG